MIAGMPAPARGLWQVPEQIIGRQAREQDRATEQLGLTQ